MVKILDFDYNRELPFSPERELGFDPNDGYFFDATRELTFAPDRDLPFGKRGVIFRGVTCQSCHNDVNHLETHCPVCGHQMAAKTSQAPFKEVSPPKESPTVKPATPASPEAAPATIGCPACHTRLMVTPPEQMHILTCSTCNATFKVDRTLDVELLTPPRTAYQIPPAEQTAYRVPPKQRRGYQLPPQQQTAYQAPQQQTAYQAPQQQPAYQAPQEFTREREFISLTDFKRHSRKR